jgi:agmatinase
MFSPVLDQFHGISSPGENEADVRILPAPLERTVSYGDGTATGPAAIIAASHQLELLDEETLVDFAVAPRVHTLPAIDFSSCSTPEECLSTIQTRVASLRDRFLVTLGGEHLLTYGTVRGLLDDLSDLTIVQLDAHADLAHNLHGQYWSHGTVMKRLLEHGCRLVQIGIRSLTREEHELATREPRITTWYGYRLREDWPSMLASLRKLSGKVYLTIDVDGLDPSIIPSTGTPQPGGLDWPQTLEIMRTLIGLPAIDLVAADVVEFIRSPHGPGCDPTAARLVAKLLAYWSQRGQVA